MISDEGIRWCVSIAGVLYIFVETFFDKDELERCARIGFEEDSDIWVLLFDLEGEAIEMK